MVQERLVYVKTQRGAGQRVVQEKLYSFLVEVGQG